MPPDDGDPTKWQEVDLLFRFDHKRMGMDVPRHVVISVRVPAHLDQYEVKDAAIGKLKRALERLVNEEP